MMKKPTDIDIFEMPPLLSLEGELTKLFKSCILDIFNKFDILIGRELSFEEFNEF